MIVTTFGLVNLIIAPAFPPLQLYHIPPELKRLRQSFFKEDSTMKAVTKSECCSGRGCT